ncbi:sugar phosphate isomerase/epimerase family protein [Pseudoteredinibacter isoporae]|uniref:Sugar phosphate isomerase/epimerase n=1 Tax=Pseudoteredinibacter isoporae TaxID=570281 RepID=A0A7X0JUK5_9GAMM|nr:sugar phosphate isomerase/epimerase [Pseudoteredinibacter isoporae]MBB6522552.1 sugar phosphate isomerase/epimerase [Pseudoteredinibacter isoporae]
MPKLLKPQLLILFCTILAGASHAEQHNHRAMPPVSIQLWSLKDDVKNDFNGTVKKLSAMGFDGVELAGDFGPFQNNPAGLRAFLSNQNLRISAAHVSTQSLSPENLPQTADFFKAMGVNILVLPYDERAYQSREIEGFIEELNRINTALNQRGFRFGFHNHEKEFDRYKNHTFWDAIAKGTPDNFILQLDIGWINKAQKDAVDYIKRYPGRMLTAHYKAKLAKPIEGKYPIIGQDDNDWAEVLKASIEVGGIEWIVLEQEEYPLGLSPLEAVRASKKALDHIIKSHNH